MEFRLGRLDVNDPEFGRLEMEGDGYAAAGELVTISILPTVQRQLGLTADQSASIADTVRQYRDRMSRGDAVASARTEAERRISATVGHDPATRLKRLSWRIRGADALLDEEVADALALGAETRTALAQAREDRAARRTAANRAFSGARFATADAFQARATEAAAVDDDMLLNVLSADQLAAFERLIR
jgi:hypothetical protein